MQKLLQGIQRFQERVFVNQKRLFENLATGQHPLALFITCSDSRICPDLLMQTDPGQLFILRTAGNIIPPYGAVQGGESGTIEYAVAALKVKDIIVCGHSCCGAMSGLLAPEKLADLPAVMALLQHAEATRRIVKENCAHIQGDAARLAAAVEANVLVQLDNLRTHPSVAAALLRRELNLHGWVYHFECGRVTSYVPEQQCFLPLEQSRSADPLGGGNLRHPETEKAAL